MMGHSELMKAFFKADRNEIAAMLKKGEDIDAREFIFTAQDVILSGKQSPFEQLLLALLNRSRELKQNPKLFNLKDPLDFIIDSLEKKEIKF